jgi:hypothetical protein
MVKLSSSYNRSLYGCNGWSAARQTQKLAEAERLAVALRQLFIEEKS